MKTRLRDWGARALLAASITLLTGTGQAHAQATNQALSVTASRAVTGTVTLSDIANPSWRGAHVVVTATAMSGGTVTPKIQGKDPVSGGYYDIATGTAISGAGSQVMKVYPGITPTTGTVADFLPAIWRVQLVGSSSPVGTLSIGGSLAP